MDNKKTFVVVALQPHGGSGLNCLPTLIASYLHPLYIRRFDLPAVHVLSRDAQPRVQSCPDMLSTAASSTPRGTATPTAEPSPITVSVVKFQCLFTHDLRRKSKRWHDGYLRYHTFNKRIMVYDDQGNFVGDHHWCSTEEVGDGDEFELDKGVLIQVGERISTTQTDISNLFEKRKSSQTSPQSKEPGHQPSRSITAIRSSGSSQPFRSLNDLLGIKRTPIGPSMSPYEARHRVPSSSHNVQSLEAERAPKRQKVAMSELALTSHRQVRDEVVDLTADEPNPVILQTTTSVQEVELSHTTDATRWNACPPSNEAPRAAITAKSVRPDSGTSAQPSNPGSSKSSNKGSINKKNSAADRATHFENPELSSPPSSYLAPPSTSHKSIRTVSDASAMPWRMQIQKPRPKLMYTALLPRGGQQKLSAPSTTSTEKQSQPISKSRVSR